MKERSPADLELRPARPDDDAAVAALAAQLGYPTTPRQARVRLEHVTARDDHAALLACSPQGDVLGFVHVADHWSLESDRSAELLALVVRDDRRGRGVGRRLVEGAARWAAARGHVELRLRSNVVRADAHRFYEALGFRRTKTQAVFAAPLAPLAARAEGPASRGIDAAPPGL